MQVTGLSQSSGLSAIVGERVATPLPSLAHLCNAGKPKLACEAAW